MDTVHPPHEDDSQPLPKVRGRVRLGRVIVAIAGGFLAVGILAALALTIALSRGALEVPTLKDRIADAMEARIGGGFDVEVGRALIQKTDAGLELHVHDFVLRDPTRRDILRAPDALVTFEILPMLVGRFVPRRIALQGATLRVIVSPEGDIAIMPDVPTVALTPEAPTPPPGAAASTTDIFVALAAIARDGQLQGFDRLAIERGSVIVDDRRTRRVIRLEPVSVAFSGEAAGRSGLTGTLSKDGQSTPFRISAETVAEGFRFDARLDGVSQAMVEAVLGEAIHGVVASTRFNLSSQIGTTTDGTLKSARARLETTGGDIRTEIQGLNTLRVDRAHLTFEWRGQRGLIDETTALFEGDGFRFGMAGTLTRQDRSGSASDLLPWRFRGTGTNWLLPPLGPKDQPVTAEAPHIEAELDPERRRFVLDRLEVRGPGSDIALSGQITLLPEGPALSADLSAGAMPIRTALRWWPAMVSIAPQTFLKARVQEGELSALRIQLEMPPPVLRAAYNLEAIPREAMRIEAQIREGSLSIFDNAPPLAGLTGQVRMDALQLFATATRAHVDLRPGRRIPFTEGSGQLDRLDTWTPQAKVRFRLQAPADQVAEMMALPPLRAAFALSVDPASVRGSVDGRADITFPLSGTLSPSDVVTTLEAAVTGLTLEKAIGQDRIENGTLTVTSDRTGIEIKGEGRWQGTPVQLGYETDAKDGSATASLAFTLDEAALKRRGIALGPQLTGPIPVKVRNERQRNGQQRSTVEADLVRTSIDGLIPGLQKAAGRPARVTFDAIERGQGYQIQNIAFDAGPTSLRGQADILADGTLTAARLSLFRLSPGDNVRLDFDRTETGARVSIRGNNFDARPFLRQVNQEAPPAPERERDLELDLRTTLLSGYGGEVITNADLKVQRVRGTLRLMSLQGRLNGKSVAVNGRSTGDTPPMVTLDIDDAGGFLRFMDVYSRMMGGDLVGQITPQRRRMSGFLMMRDFTLRNEPAIRRLVAEAPQQGARLSDSEVRFTKMRIDFTREGSETKVQDATIFGPQIGLSFNGLVDNARDRISMSGTFIPAFGLNNAFAQIPLVGGILGGGRNEGLLGVTFGVSGRAAQPTITVNPLSAVTPGIFRKIFEFSNDTTRAAPFAQPPGPN